MKKLILTVALMNISTLTFAADLLDVYRKAQISDPIFQQSVAERLSTKEGVPISLASLLPNLLLNFNPTVSRTGYSGANIQTDAAGSPLSPRNNTQRAYNLTLSLTQTVFDYSQIAGLEGALATSKAADATLNSALQDLIVRASRAYFSVLENEDKLRYTKSAKVAYKEQLEQARQQYKVGLKTITDVYTAQASYDTAVANVVAQEAQVANARENLRMITGQYYPSLAKLSDKLPLITPEPHDMETWVNTALKQNWAIKTAQYIAEGKLKTVHQQFAGHLPTVQVQGAWQRQYAENINNYPALTTRDGPATSSIKSAGINISFPIFSGGAVVAQTNQASYNYQASQQQLEQTVRSTLNQTRQSYMNVLSGISQINADRQAIKSNMSSLEGMRASYSVGTETLVNVLNQQQKLFESQTEYATDRYAFVNNVLLLKQAAGTLSFDDLRTLNNWLTTEEASSLPLQTTLTQPNVWHKHHAVKKQRLKTTKA